MLAKTCIMKTFDSPQRCSGACYLAHVDRPSFVSYVVLALCDSLFNEW